MYEIRKTSQFKKDFKLILKRGNNISKIETLFNLLILGEKLPEKYKEHPLKSNFKDHFDCHIEPDWLLIFKRDENEKMITLVRTGTHSDIFG
ncbi:MAG: type II toxin-antitoxin system YafQ family toxin [Bacteroidales bacterium]